MVWKAVLRNGTTARGGEDHLEDVNRRAAGTACSCASAAPAMPDSAVPASPERM